jgi:Golgi phosphoprotein 3 (GPP34)
MQHFDLRLHDEYFLLAHDGYTGRAHIKDGVLAVGLAGALLCELLVVGCLEVADGTVRLRDGGLAGDTVSRTALAAIHHRSHALPWWVECLAQSTYPLAAKQLTRRGVVSPASAGLFRTGTRYVANDALLAARPRIGLRYAAESYRQVPPDARTTALAALAMATGLEGVVADAANRVLRDGVHALAAGLPRDLRPVLAAVDVTVMRLAMATPRGR